MQTATLVQGALIGLGVAFAGFFIGNGFVDARALERSVTVKGLSEREVPADVAIWPLQFNIADNQLDSLVKRIEQQTQAVVSFLKARGFTDAELTLKPPTITDKQAQSYGNENVKYRYLAQAVVTVYTDQIEQVLNASKDLLELGKTGVVFSQDNYEYRTQYLYQGLNDIKPQMIEEATQNARLVAETFAKDSDSQLGKIKSARQGQFSINDRDSNNPHIKNVRVVSTLQYYLAD